MALVKEQTSKTSLNDWMAGEIKWFDLKKGFGFVRLANDKVDAFLHASVLKAAHFATVPPEMKVEVKLEQVGLRYRVTNIKPGK